MADAMVTARMPIRKKETGNRVLERLGTNASQVINELYDYVLENEALPFGRLEGGGQRVSEGEFREALAYVRKFPKPDPDNELLDMEKKELRKRKAADRGLWSERDEA